MMASAYRGTEALSENPGTFNLGATEDWAANTVAIQGAPVSMDANVDYVQVTVTAIVNGVINWYTSATGGTSIGTGAPFNPAGVPGSGLTNTSVPGTWSYWAECSNVPGCRTQSDFVIKPLPPAPVAGDNGPACEGGTLILSASDIPGATYRWTGPDGFVSNVQNPLVSNDVTAAMAGTYSVIATVNGCDGPAGTITVDVNIHPVLAAIGTKNVDEESPITFQATGTDIDTSGTVAYLLS